MCLTQQHFHSTLNCCSFFKWLQSWQKGTCWTHRERILHHEAEEKCLAQHSFHCASKPGIEPNVKISQYLVDYERMKARAPAAALRCDNPTDSRPARLPHRVNFDLRRLAEIRERIESDFGSKQRFLKVRKTLLSQQTQENCCRSQTRGWHPLTKTK